MLDGIATICMIVTESKATPKWNMNTLFNRILALSSLVVLISGCAPIRYSEYTGHDVNSILGGAWTTGQGTMAETSYALPVYRGWPERHYAVLGSLSFPDPNKTWDEGIISSAARSAKAHKADAIIIRQGAEFGVSKIADAKGDPLVVSSSYQTTALAVRWLTQNEISHMEKLKDDLLARVASVQSLVQPNRTVAQLVLSYLVQTGVDLRSEQSIDKFQAIASRLISHSPESLAGEWIFKTTVSASSALSSGHERNFFGIANVTEDRDDLTIVSSDGGVEMNFAGNLTNHHVAGQLGIGSVSAKCEGVATPEKISITFQSLTSDGTVRGNIVLQRLLPKNNQYEKANPSPSPRSRS
jgi:hypothetical protein